MEGAGNALGALELVRSMDDGTALLDVAVAVDGSDATALVVPDPEGVAFDEMEDLSNDAVDFALLLDWRDPELPSVVRVAG